jgi:hypothetical protein
VNFTALIPSMIRTVIRRGEGVLILLVYVSSSVTAALPLVVGQHSPSEQKLARSTVGSQSCNCSCRTRGDGICRCASCNKDTVCACDLSSDDQQPELTGSEKDATLAVRIGLAPVVRFSRRICQLPSRLISPVLPVPTPPPEF